MVSSTANGCFSLSFDYDFYKNDAVQRVTLNPSYICHSHVIRKQTRPTSIHLSNRPVPVQWTALPFIPPIENVSLVSILCHLPIFKETTLNQCNRIAAAKLLEQVTKSTSPSELLVSGNFHLLSSAYSPVERISRGKSDALNAIFVCVRRCYYSIPKIFSHPSFIEPRNATPASRADGLHAVQTNEALTQISISLVFCCFFFVRLGRIYSTNIVVDWGNDLKISFVRVSSTTRSQVLSTYFFKPPVITQEWFTIVPKRYQAK